jgi:hypothetical protein
MANEITTSTLDDLTHGYLIEPVLIQALSEQPGLFRFCREFNLIGKATNAAQIPTETAYWGSANDRGNGVATAFNGTQATSLSNTAVSSGNVTCTAAEYGVAHALTDNVAEDSVDGIDLMMLFTDRMLRVLQLAMDDDYIANYANLSQTVGSSRRRSDDRAAGGGAAGPPQSAASVADAVAYVARQHHEQLRRDRAHGDQRRGRDLRAVGGPPHQLRAVGRQRHERGAQGDDVPRRAGVQRPASLTRRTPAPTKCRRASARRRQRTTRAARRPTAWRGSASRGSRRSARRSSARRISS